MWVVTLASKAAFKVVRQGKAAGGVEVVGEVL